MAIKTKGMPEHYVERVFRDRLGFVQVVVAKTYASEEFIELPPPPEQTYLGAVWNRTDVTGQNGIVQVRWLYEGLEENGGKVYEYNWDTSYDTVPIQAHPDFKQWIGVYGLIDPSGNWLPLQEVNEKAMGGRVMKNNKGGKKNPLLGVESYLSVGGVWTRRRAERGGNDIESAHVPEDVMEGVGFIVNKPPGPVPPMPPDRNWLKGPPQMRFRGNAWDITEQWILSGNGGWSEVLYNNKNL